MSISTMNDDLNILQNLAIPAFEEDVDVIQKLDDEPNDVGGLTAAELKAKFDEAGNRIKTYLNETLVPSISETVAEAEERAEAEAARVLAEEQRAAAEQERVSSEAEREQAEAERRAGEADRAAAEAERKTAEDARVLAEQKREDTDSGIVAQATSAAEAAENAANKAASAAIHQPIVGDNGNWHTWSFDAGAYVDTGIYAGGDAPYIGENGNWYVGQTDTGVSATSTGVYVGSGNMPEGYHLQIDPDGEETDFIPYIGANGNWFVGDTDLEVQATGPIGPIGDTGATGPEGPAGSDGQDGITPTIGDNGNWYLGDTDTGKPSRGETGQAGADGRDGADGQPGADGKSAYQYAVEGGYTGTEEAFAAKLSKEMPDKLPNPNALNFTGAVSGSYDGSAPLEVAIPSGGGGLTVTNTAAVGQTVKIAAVDENGQPTEWEAVDMASGEIEVQSGFELIDSIDWSTEDMAQAGVAKEYTLNGVTEIIIVWQGMANKTQTTSLLGVNLNGSNLSGCGTVPTSNAGSTLNGFTYYRCFEGVGTLAIRSPGAKSVTSVATNAQIPYSLFSITEKITKLRISNSAGYVANTGITKIYVR